MGLFECILKGNETGEEMVAETRGKARYRYYLQVRESMEDVQFQDITVKSLNSRKAAPMAAGWEDRLVLANSIVRVIAAHGRHFLSENSDKRDLVPNPFIAHFTVDKKGELWFIDRYTRKPVLVRHREWPHFTDGGTLRGIITHLAEHITQDSPINPGYFGLSPDWMPNHWGYGEDMAKVRDGVAELLRRARPMPCSCGVCQGKVPAMTATKEKTEFQVGAQTERRLIAAEIRLLFGLGGDAALEILLGSIKERDDQDESAA